jgi:transposase-like protein
VFLKLNGELHYIWRAVDQHSIVLDILVRGRRNATAAKRFFRRLLVGLKYRPKRLVTDGLCSYSAANVAPLGWEHVGLTGDYVWAAEAQPITGELRPLRDSASLLAA